MIELQPTLMLTDEELEILNADKHVDNEALATAIDAAIAKIEEAMKALRPSD
ncbi:hypothetical protein [Sphingobium bisphenolivorans]|uniref:hypothetical protein n=1 Tax=Sphingobium bisphenolivorans TaxID=1335760 RepID=UPI0003A6B424|nr:hypothetical protein [Sphingobium bisphenolivorans]